MIKYEVNLEINKTIDENFLEWLPHHIDEILKFKGFQNASIFTDNSCDSELYCKITVHYELDSREDLQNYFDNHATTMRDKTVKMFGDNFKASRRILELTKKFYK